MRAENGLYTKIETDATGRETIRDGETEYAFHYYPERMSQFALRTIDGHWHPEIEVLYVESGRVRCMVGADTFDARAGQCVFVNARAIHSFTSEEDASIPNFLFLPSLLADPGSLLYRKYVRPVVASPHPYLLLTGEEAETRAGRPDAGGRSGAAPGGAENGRNRLSGYEIIRTVRNIIDVQRDPAQSGLRELRTCELLFRFWEQICTVYRRFPKETPAAGFRAAREQARLQAMLGYILENYSRPLSLDEIAASAGVSKSSALGIFRGCLHTTPVSCLIRCRLRNAAELLAVTDDSVQSIARRTGFESTGYFCRRFRSAYGVTPSEYRIRSASD